ncbi:MAG: hypothetical protein EXQ69_00480 [Acidimicrobiia bacterium]|nr:hypothetical protein [Acidimicrobiia bacterium]
MINMVRRIALPLVLVLVTAAVVLVIAVRPGLQGDAEAVDRAWEPLAKPLAVRYEALAGVAEALDAAGASDRDVTRRLRRVLSDWDLLVVTTDSPTQAITANELEGLAARVGATVASSEKFKNDSALTAAITTFNEAIPTPKQVATYNGTVEVYAGSRDGFWRGIVASLDDYPARPTLQPSTA